MRRILRHAPVLALAFAVSAALAAPAAAQKARAKPKPKPDLVVSAAAEPPDFVPLDGDFLASFTVDNQGRGRARQTSLARAYLSVGRVLSADDRRRRVGQRRVRPLAPGRSASRRMVVEIPPTFQTGEFFLIVCADVRNVVKESNDRANCNVSGQRIRIAGSDTAGGAGPPGPPGPAGPAGPPGDSNTIIIPRKTLPFGVATIEGENADVNPPGSPNTTKDERGPGDNEGSTEQFDLLEVGGVKIRALCRSTTNGDDDVPGFDGDNDGFLGVDNDFSFDEDGDEAKILLYLDRPEGNFSFAGPHGRRFNINAGFGNTSHSVDATRGDTGRNFQEGGDTGGEGKHMALATAADPEVRIAGDADDSDNGIGEDTGPDAGLNDPNQGSSQNTRFEPQDDWEAAFRNGSIYVATSSGTEFILNAYAGIGVLGASPTQCVFGGSVTKIHD
ncbi:MAG TPA: CARDB domain-containing protein [Solirubrobacteraceae bacterium]|jgi:hypothetical protein